MTGQGGQDSSSAPPTTPKSRIHAKVKHLFGSRSKSRDGRANPSITDLASALPTAVQEGNDEIAPKQPVNSTLSHSSIGVTDIGHPPAGSKSQGDNLITDSLSPLPATNHVASTEANLTNTVTGLSYNFHGPVAQISRPINELWDQAYDHLRSVEKNLVDDYEAALCGELSAMVGSTVGLLGMGIKKEDQMRTILKRKMEEVNQNIWKLKFHGGEFPVKDMIGSVVGVIDWANQFISKALSTNPYASIAWAGVGLLLPLFLNPSQQSGSLASGLEYISGLIVQSTIRESLYRRRYESNSSLKEPNGFLPSHIAYRDALKELYTRILKFQATSVCYYFKNTGSRVILDMVKYDDWNSLVDSIRTQEEEFRKINELWKDTKYEEECTAVEKRHQECIKSLLSIGSDVSGLRKAVEDAQNDRQRKELLDWLSSIDPSENYNSARDKHEATTGNWLLNGNEDFKRWKTAPNSLLWLHGKAGCGKSVLSSSVIKNLSDFHDSKIEIAIAYFYFSFSDVEKQNTVGMLGSLIKQLCCRRPDTPKLVKDLAQYKDKGQRPDRKTLETTLLATLQGFSQVFLVIDALDECPPQIGERKTLLGCIHQIFMQQCENLHLLCTSRREPDIEAALNPLLSLPSSVALDLSSTYKDAVDQDIGTYIDEELVSSEYDSWPESLKAEAKATLIKNADGMFQYVSYQFESLRDSSSLSLVREALKSLPKGLDATYNRMLASIHPDYQKQVGSLLKCLAFSFRPLTVDELAEAFMLDYEQSVPFDETRRLFKSQDVLKYLPGLVTTVPIHVKRLGSPWDNTNVEEVKLAHFSIKEYLISERIRDGPGAKFSVAEKDAHLHIAELCLAYHLKISEIELATKESVERYALWEYAAIYWKRHLEEVAQASWTASVTKLAVLHFIPHSQSLLNMVRIQYPPYNFPSWKIEIDELASSLSYTALLGAVQLTSLLITNGADVNERLRQGEFGDALQAAAIRGNESIVQLLLEKGADVNAQGGKYGNALQAAALSGNESIVQLLLEKGADVNAQGGLYENALQAAARFRNESTVQLLIEKGANVNARGGKHGNALQAAAMHGNESIVQLLLENGANVNAQGGNYGNALQAAARTGNKSIMQLLIEEGADVNAQGGVYGNALQAAAMHGNESIVQLLLKEGANVSAQGGEYGNALQAAVWMKNKSIVQLLLEKGADVNARGRYGNALHVANEAGDFKISQLLKSHGAEE